LVPPHSLFDRQEKHFWLPVLQFCPEGQAASAQLAALSLLPSPPPLSLLSPVTLLSAVSLLSAPPSGGWDVSGAVSVDPSGLTQPMVMGSQLIPEAHGLWVSQKPDLCLMQPPRAARPKERQSESQR
jgi:hypothetical protein